jgi:TonB family protein
MLKQIGKFTISERIGRGTYSRVYRAMDQQGRPVAIKISTTPTEQEHLSDFQRDLVSAASVLHPNLVSVHDLGFENEFPYVVMELVEGKDVAKLIQTQAKTSLGERVRVMLQVGEALKSAHERGVFHLDVRPSKIMLADDGSAKLLDLGLGRLSYDESRVTDRGYLIGSPFYMSPERLMSIDTANAQCDIWSFGVTLHEWISGQHPFYDDDGDRMIGNIMDNSPAELEDVTGSLHRLIRQTLEKDPASRYRSFTELIADLKSVARELQRGESDAMLAEALKQTDSGQWYEARRIARQMGETKPAAPSAAHFFGVSEAKAQKERIPEPPSNLADPVPPVPEPVSRPLAAAAAATIGNPELRETVETPAPPPVSPAWQRELRSERTVPDSSVAQLPVPVPRPTVRILAADEPNGFPWAKIAAFAVAALLVAGVLLFLWGPYSGLVGKGELSAEAKALSPAGRDSKTKDIPDLSAANPGAPAPPDGSALLSDPKPFDPKSLTVSTPILTLPVRQRSNGTGSLRPPSLGENSMTSDLAIWPGMLKAPAPPPASVAPNPPAPVAPNPPIEKPVLPQSMEAVQAAAIRVGGSFSQPVLVHSVPPIYPVAALQRKAQGVVRFAATITKDGAVKNLQVLSGDPLLDVAAKEAVLQWKYRPALLNGEAVEVTQAIVVKFNLSQ